MIGPERARPTDKAFGMFTTLSLFLLLLLLIMLFVPFFAAFSDVLRSSFSPLFSPPSPSEIFSSSSSSLVEPSSPFPLEETERKEEEAEEAENCPFLFASVLVVAAVAANPLLASPPSFHFPDALTAA
jgi:hypothetical protein